MVLHVDMYSFLLGKCLELVGCMVNHTSFFENDTLWVTNPQKLSLWALLEQRIQGWIEYRLCWHGIAYILMNLNNACIL